MNPYKTLEIEKDASEAEIKKAYRKISKKCHPDLHPDDKEAEDRFKEVSEAYSILSDPQKKANYDRFGTVGGQPTGFPSNFGPNIFFNFASPRMHVRTINPDSRASIRLSLENAIFGCEIKYSLRRIITCDDCKSLGGKETEVICTKCNGSGQISFKTNEWTHFVTNCDACEGRGKEFEKCSSCDGGGFLQSKETTKIKIPKNLKPNATIRIKEKGNHVLRRDGEYHTGDHYIIADFPLSEDGVTLKGKDLYADLQVTVDKILAEDEVYIRLFDKVSLPFKLKSNQDFNKNYEVETNFLNGGKLFVKVLPQIPSKYIDEDKRKSLVKALREAYGESESVIQPTRDGS